MRVPRQRPDSGAIELQESLMQRKTLVGAAIAATLLALGAGAQAADYTRTVTTTTITVAPPAPRHEVIPAARAGWIWAPGHYEWRHGEYRWEEGHWMRERAGYEYREPRWVQRGNGEWVMVGGNWEHHWDERHADDRRWDRRHRHAARDWDGDGVPDRRDRFPRNRNRS
jgi:hypothetical protein